MTPDRPQTGRLPRGAVMVMALLLLVGCAGEGADEYSTGAEESRQGPVTVPDLSEKARRGEAIFAEHCSECHGADAGGSSQGPPLVHKIYEPGHHGDLSFHLAVRRGVQQHHWPFGNMDPLPGIETADIDEIVCYVRELQYANGVFSDASGLIACQG